ncbi:MAG: flagellar hook protein FlgE [Desulfuromonadales bacterium]|nr:flagellar hook protein FlgE [Desulfuromonadales bacterium]
MGVSSALYSGVSGLNANANAMSVIGNNIANANTIGFKSSRAIFGDLLSSQISGSGGTSQVGRGVGLSIVDNVFSQGTFENTETNTDLAVEGAGFFIVSDPSTGNASNNYTRAGAFRFNAEGFLVNPEGYNLMGFQLDENGNTIGDLTPIWTNTQSFTPAEPTSSVDLNTNLDSDSVTIPNGATAASNSVDAEIIAAGGVTNVAYTNLAADPDNAALQTAALTQATADAVTYAGNLEVLAAISDLQDSITYPYFNPNDPTASSNYATSIQVFDSLGSTHLMTTYFTKTDDQNWTWNTVVNGSEVTGGTPGELEIVGNGTLVFDSSGDLITIDGVDMYTIPGDTSSDPVFPRPMATTTGGALDWINGSIQTQQVDIDMQTSQYSSPSVVVSQEQDGFGTGTLVKLSVDEFGNVIGNFSNGTPRRLMRLGLAKFTNPNSLDKIGNNMYAQSNNSGVPVVGTVGSGVGRIFTNALELSNVDLAQEFVKMITTQRGFSANSKTITTTDEMLAEVINLKR